MIEFSPIFVADTKLTFHYKFGAPLTNFSAVNKNWFLIMNPKNGYKHTASDIKERETNYELFNVILIVKKPINDKK